MFSRPSNPSNAAGGGLTSPDDGVVLVSCLPTLPSADAHRRQRISRLLRPPLPGRPGEDLGARLKPMDCPTMPDPLLLSATPTEALKDRTNPASRLADTEHPTPESRCPEEVLSRTTTETEDSDPVAESDTTPSERSTAAPDLKTAVARVDTDRQDRAGGNKAAGHERIGTASTVPHQDRAVTDTRRDTANHQAGRFVEGALSARDCATTSNGPQHRPGIEHVERLQPGVVPPTPYVEDRQHRRLGDAVHFTPPHLATPASGLFGCVVQFA